MWRGTHDAQRRNHPGYHPKRHRSLESRSLKTRKPTATEMRQAGKILSATDDPKRQWGADVILLYAAGLNAPDIAQAIDAHVNTIYSDLCSFDRCDLKRLDRLN